MVRAEIDRLYRDLHGQDIVHGDIALQNIVHCYPPNSAYQDPAALHEYASILTRAYFASACRSGGGAPCQSALGRCVGNGEAFAG